MGNQQWWQSAVVSDLGWRGARASLCSVDARVVLDHAERGPALAFQVRGHCNQ